MFLVHHIGSPNSIVSAPSTKEMRRRQQAVKRMDRWRGGGGCPTLINQTHIFEHVHEAWSKAPGFVSVALKGADSDLGGALRGSSHHVHGVVHQSCLSLKEKHRRHHHLSGWDHKSRPALITSGLLMHSIAWFLKAHPKTAVPVLQATWRAIKAARECNFIQSTFLIVHTIRGQQLLYSDNEGPRLILCKSLAQLPKISYVFTVYIYIVSQWLGLDF